MQFFDSHVHSYHSHDSRQTMEDIFVAAVRGGLSGVAITDHADIWYLEKDRAFEHIAAAAMEARLADKMYEGQVRFFAGIELGDQLDDSVSTERMLHLVEYDVVLGSVHCVQFEDWDDAYSRIAFDESVSVRRIEAFLEEYFWKVLALAQTQAYDILTHLTCPLRYINGKYHRGIDLNRYQAIIAEIFQALISREKTLEVNTSGVGHYYGALMPDETILRQYYAMGGRRISLGSDAHAPANIGNSFAETIERLKRIGFDGYSYYDKRREIFAPFS